MDQKSTSKYVNEVEKQYIESSIYSVECVEKAVKSADIIVTVTFSRKPLVSGD